MPVAVQRRMSISDMYFEYIVRQDDPSLANGFNPYGLYLVIGRMSDNGPIGGLRVLDYPLISGGLLEDEAEAITGLFAPACWDKLLEEV